MEERVTHVDFTRVQHINAIVDGYHASIDHFRDVFGAPLNLEVARADVDICLITVGGVIFELTAPKPDHPSRRRASLERRGEHYSGVEYQVDDLAVAKERVREKGLGILVDTPLHFVTDPADSFGVAFEVYQGDWHADPPPVAFAEPIGDAERWRDRSPFGFLGLARYSVAVRDLDGATAFFRDLTGAPVRYRAERPGATAEAVGLQIGDGVTELIAPVGPGPIAAFLDASGERIRATTFAVRDLAQVERHLASHGLDLVAGDAPGTMALPAEANHGLRFEFCE